MSGGAPSRLRLLQERERRQGLLTPRHRGLRLALHVFEREEPESKVRMAVFPSRQLILKPPELSEALRLIREQLPDPGLGGIEKLTVREK